VNGNIFSTTDIDVSLAWAFVSLSVYHVVSLCKHARMDPGSVCDGDSWEPKEHNFPYKFDAAFTKLLCHLLSFTQQKNVPTTTLFYDKTVLRSRWWQRQERWWWQLAQHWQQCLHSIANIIGSAGNTFFTAPCMQMDCKNCLWIITLYKVYRLHIYYRLHCILENRPAAFNSLYYVPFVSSTTQPGHSPIITHIS